MAKSKTQKQQEAGWRATRGDLVQSFRAGGDDKVLAEYGQWFIEKREQLWQDYLALPRTWRDTAMVGWSLPPHLQDRLEREGVEQHARELDAGTIGVGVARRRVRL